jgi:hypothetical protein
MMGINGEMRKASTFWCIVMRIGTLPELPMRKISFIFSDVRWRPPPLPTDLLFPVFPALSSSTITFVGSGVVR